MAFEGRVLDAVVDLVADQPDAALLAGARQRGELVDATLDFGPTAATYNVLIEVDAQGPSAMGTIAQKLIGERRAGVYTWDAAQIYTVTAFSTFKPEGFWAPIRPCRTSKSPTWKCRKANRARAWRFSGATRWAVF